MSAGGGGSFGGIGWVSDGARRMELSKEKEETRNRDAPSHILVPPDERCAIF